MSMSNNTKDLADAIKASIEKANTDPEYIAEVSPLIESFFKIQAMSPPNQPIYSAVLDALGVPVRFKFDTKAYGAYCAKIGKNEEDHYLGDEHINISTMWYEILKNPRDYGVRYPVYELAFVYAHELYHARFRHLNKQKILSKEYPLPHVVYNIVFDIMINTLLKYNDPLTNKVGGNAMNLVMFKNGMRYYENVEDLKSNIERAKKVLAGFEVESTDSELIGLNVLGNKNIERHTDDELAQVFHHLFKDLLDPYQQMFEQAMDEIEKGQPSQGAQGAGDQDEEGQGDGEGEQENDGQGDPNKSGQGKGQGVSSGEDEDQQPQNASGEGDEEEEKSYHDKVKERFNEKMKERAANDPEFAKAMKRFVANFSDLPSPEVQMTIEAGMKGGVMTPEEIAEAVRGRQTMQDAVTEINEKHAGTIPGWLRSFADVKPKRPSYLSQLQQFGNRHIGETRKTYSPPNKKHSRSNLLIPSKIGSALDIAFIIDTSGSMSQDEIMPVLGQINAVLRKAPASSKIHVLFNDAGFQHEVIRGKNIAKFKKVLEKGVQGGGGSVFDQVFKHKALKKVDAVIFLSDFYIFIPDTLKVKKPMVCLHTEQYNKEVMNEVLNRANYSIALPAGRLD